MPKEPQTEISLPVETAPEVVEALETVPEDAGTEPLPPGSVKQTVSKELKELVKSYVEYAKNVDL